MTTVQTPPQRQQFTAFARRMKGIGTENAFKVGPYIREVEARGERVIKCNLGEPDFPLPKHIAEDVKRAIDADQTHYVDPQGIEPLRKAIAKTMGEKRGLKITPDRVVVFPGAKPPIGFAQHAYCDPGDEVIYPSPGFPIYESFIRYIDAVPVPLHMLEENGFACGGDQLAPLINECTKLIYLNFPSNPTGGVATAEQLDDLAAVIRRKLPPNSRVYSDEVYEDIIYDGERHRSIASSCSRAPSRRSDSRRRSTAIRAITSSIRAPGSRSTNPSRDTSARCPYRCTFSKRTGSPAARARSSRCSPAARSCSS